MKASRFSEEQIIAILREPRRQPWSRRIPSWTMRNWSSVRPY